LANTFAYVSPVIAVILGWAILKEPLASLTVVAMGVILAGAALMVTTSSKIKEKKPSPQQQKANI
jgi:drug/metabolite transporter (DMT)-like permease